MFQGRDGALLKRKGALASRNSYGATQERGRLRPTSINLQVQFGHEPVVFCFPNALVMLRNERLRPVTMKESLVEELQIDAYLHREDVEAGPQIEFAIAVGVFEESVEVDRVPVDLEQRPFDARIPERLPEPADLLGAEGLQLSIISLNTIEIALANGMQDQVA